MSGTVPVVVQIAICNCMVNNLLFLKRNFLQMTDLNGFESRLVWSTSLLKFLLFYDGVFGYIIHLCHCLDQFRTFYLANSAPANMSGTV